jgi:predicted metalloprotease
LILTFCTGSDIEEALNTVAVVGDDWIQKEQID